jgi:hypothetical protein
MASINRLLIAIYRIFNYDYMARLVQKLLLTVVLFFVVMTCSFADTPPDPGGDPSNTGTPVGGSPVGSGLVILVSLAAAYGSKKVYNSKEEK